MNYSESLIRIVTLCSDHLPYTTNKEEGGERGFIMRGGLRTQ